MLGRVLIAAAAVTVAMWVAAAALGLSDTPMQSCGVECAR